jgi:hypothetical protein
MGVDKDGVSVTVTTGRGRRGQGFNVLGARAWAVEEQVEVCLTGCETNILPPSTTIWILSPSRRAEVDRTACFPLGFLPPHSIAGVLDPFVGSA